MNQVKSGFVLETDVKTISRQIISIVTQVKRDRELKQQADASAHATVPPAQSTPGVAVTSSSTSLPPTAAAAATQQPRPQGWTKSVLCKTTKNLV